MRIPITMCHGIHGLSKVGGKPLTAAHFDALMRIAAELGFQSISYDALAAWRDGAAGLPPHPIMIDLDHPVKSMRYEVKDVLDRYGFKANLFVQVAPIEELLSGPSRPLAERQVMTWDELAELQEAGWLIGAHTTTHPNLSKLSQDDPSGEKLRWELDHCNDVLAEHLGRAPKDFAFTGTSWSSAAEREVKKRYRFGRLWITGAWYSADGVSIRYADLVGVPGDDEPDGGPPAAARYITSESDPYRLPSMEIQELIYSPEAFRQYLEGALAG